MADVDQDGHPTHAQDGELEEDEEWLDPVDVDALPDGSRTTFVGGAFSSFKSLTSLLEATNHPLRAGDKVVVLPGTYDQDAILDTHTHRGVTIVGDAASDVSAVVFTGQLALQQSAQANAAAAAAPPPTDDTDDGAPKAPPAPLAIGHMTFLSGAILAELSDADVSDCVFGGRHIPQLADKDASLPARMVACHGFSVVRLTRCKIWGFQLSAVYGFPYSRVTASQCDIIGADRPPAKVQEAHTYRRKLVVEAAASAAPTGVPATCEVEVGVELDNAEMTFRECTISNCNIGLLVRDASKKSTLEKSVIAQIATVGILLEAGACMSIRGNKVKHCGRECLVLGNKAHPIIRDNVFVGDVRLKAEAVTTGVCDNVLALNGKLLEGQQIFSRRGFTTIATDPTAPKVKKSASAA